MSIIFKLINSGFECKCEKINNFNLRMIYDFYLSNGLNQEELGKIKFIIDSDEIDTFEISYTIKDNETALIYVYTEDIIILHKLNDIFQETNTIDLNDTMPQLTDKIIDEMNKKSVELFKEPDFRTLIRIYMNKPELFSIMAKYIQSGNVIEEVLPQSDPTKLFNNSNIEEQKKYMDLCIKIQELGINCDSEIIYAKLYKYSGHLNLTVRDLLCEFANIS